MGKSSKEPELSKGARRRKRNRIKRADLQARKGNPVKSEPENGERVEPQPAKDKPVKSQPAKGKAVKPTPAVPMKYVF
jgi:hypothetical protein